MDATDLDIVRILRKDGRMTHEQLAREIHLSRPAVHERIKRLEQDGVIRGYEAKVNWEAIGLPLTAFIWIRTSTPCLPVATKILQLSSSVALVDDCHRVAGEWCLLVKVHASSSLALQDLLDNIGITPGVNGTMTTVALSSVEAKCGKPEALSTE